MDINNFQSMSNNNKESLKPIKGAMRSNRKRIGLRGEFVLALLPTATILVVLAFVEVLSHQRLLFASLSSSAFLIYLDPNHGTNSVRTLLIAQISAATIGLIAYLVIGDGLLSGGIAMLTVIILMILVDAMHPPAVATALSFAFRAGAESNLVLFILAVGITAILVVLEKAAVWLLSKYHVVE